MSFGLSAGRSVAVAVLALCCASDSWAQSSASSFSIRFFGTGTAQRDRIKIPVDDDVAGSAGNTPIDVGAGDFTIEFWVKGNLADNPTANAGGDVDLLTNAWMNGNVVVDRDILGGSDADFGVSIAGGFVRFGTGRGQTATDNEHTLEGNTLVLDGAWHHVAVVRERDSGEKAIYVDGALDVHSMAGASTADLSYPDGGVVGAQDALGRFLVIGAAKHDLPQFPAFNGFIDEIRIWSVARSHVQVLEALDRVLLPLTPGLVGSYRLEEGVGTVAHDTSGANAPSGTIASGPAMATWMSGAVNATHTAVVSNTGLPPGFERTQLVTNLNEPTVLEFLPDGRLLIGERGGAIKVYANGQLQAAPLAQIAVDTTNGERGLVGLAAHPQFVTNGYLYAFYTTSEPRDRVARFTVQGASVDPLSETLIWQNDHLASDFHHGGALAFGADGKLYVTVGDNFVATRAQDLTAFDGKLLRLNDDGSVPSDNPFVGASGAKPAIYAYGLRNPFRSSVDPRTGQMWIGDVGGNNLTSWEEANLVQPAANFGWPDSEADECFLADCSGFAKPHFAYQHIDPEYYLLVPQGSITMGPRVRAAQFPAGYRDCLYVGDFVNRWMRRLVFDANGDVVADPLFLYPPYAGTIVDMRVGPDGALYYLTFGGAIGSWNDASALYRIRALGGGNAAPVVFASAASGSGPAPQAVQFSSAGTFDPDAGPQPLSYAWTFGDGGTSNLPQPLHTYAANGLKIAQLAVSDGSATTLSAPIVVAVGTPPVPLIVAPLPGQPYAAGDTIRFLGSATDAEDGTLPASAFSWKVMLHHHEHEHPFLGPLTGVTQGQFTVPATGHGPDDTHYVIRLTVTDADGLTTTTEVELEPEHSALGLQTEPFGLPLLVDAENTPTPTALESLVGFTHVVEAPAIAMVGGQAYAFQCWSDGGARQHAVTAPQGALHLTARYQLLPSTTLNVPVAAIADLAQYESASGVVHADAADPATVRVGKQPTLSPLQLGARFALNVPSGATILSAKIEFVAGAQQDGAPQAIVRAFDVGDAPAFVAGSSTPLTQLAPWTSEQISYTFPTWLPGATYATPDLAALVQTVVDRPDWLPGNHVGLVFDGSPTVFPQWRSARNVASGQPPRLILTYAQVPTGGGSCPAGCGFTAFGLGAAPSHTLGLVGNGDPRVGGLFEVEAFNLGGAAVAGMFLSTTAGATPFYGGQLLVGPVGFIGLIVLPVIEGESGFELQLPNDPGIAGLSLFVQTAAPDANQAQGVAFSNGLQLTICPP